MKLSLTPIKVSKGFLSNPDKVSRAVENALTGAALGAKADFEVTQQTWSGKSKGDFKIKSGPGERLIYTDSKIYGYVDKGTRAHIIRAKRKTLAFKGGYKAKTSPGRIGSTSGGASGGWMFAKAVRHPGTKARNFSKVIAAKWSKELPKIMQRAVDSAM